MPTKKSKEKTEEKKFFEIEGEFQGLKLSARVYPVKEDKGVKRSFMYLNLGYGFNVQASFVETKNAYFIAFPQYKTGDNYKSYIFVEKDSLYAKALDELADEIYNKK